MRPLLLLLVYVLLVLLKFTEHKAFVAAASVRVLANGRFYTVDPAQPWAQAVAFDDHGTLLAVGSHEEVLSAYDADAVATTTDLQGRLVLPGFQDVHLHAVEAGINAQICYVPDDTANIQTLPAILQGCPNGGRFGDQGWIMGVGIDVGLLLEELDFDANLPFPITVLDEAYPETPVVILDNLGHAALCNTAAMKAVGYDVLQDDPPGGRILRDDNNDPIGIVTENAQQKLRDAAFPPTSDANQEVAYQSLLDALERLNRHGITSVSDAGGFWRQAQTESWQRALDDGRLTVRAANALYVYPDEPIQTQLLQLQQRYSNDPVSRLRFNTAKIYVDGILSLATAALYEPYLADLLLPPQDELGFEYFGNDSSLNSTVQQLVNAGFQLHMHVTGDRGAGLALDAIEAASSMNTNPTSSTGPHRLTHCYLIDDRDRGRFQNLSVIADFQLAPSSLTTDYRSFLRDFVIGPEREAALLPAKAMHQTGAMVTLSSDWDADVLSPLVKLETVLTRTDGQAFDSLDQVIPMLTINPAIALQHADKTGSIQVGKFADLVVLDTDIFQLPTSEISSAKVSRTYLQGEVVFDLGDFEGTDGDDTFFGESSGAYWSARFVWVFAAALLIIPFDIIRN